MGSSVVKPSRRESRRRGVNAASASGGDVQQKDEGYKVDTLAIPVSNYCKPVTVVLQTDNIKNAPLPSQVSGTVSKEGKLTNYSEISIRKIQSMESEYISPVLKKDYSRTGAQESMQTSRSRSRHTKAGSGDSSTLGIPLVSTDQQKPPSRRKKIFSGSCLGRRGETQKPTSDSQKKPCTNAEVKGKDNDNEANFVEPEHDDQDVSRDARTPSPVFNDFENVIVTEPTTLKGRASTSSPIDNYIPSKDVDAVNEESIATVSITKSDNPAPVHQGELRCELKKNTSQDISSTTLGNELTDNQIQGHGDTPSLNADKSVEIQKDVALLCDFDLSKSYEQGDSISEKTGKIKETQPRHIGNSEAEKHVSQESEDESTLHVSESSCADVEAQNEPDIPVGKIPVTSRIIAVEPAKQCLNADEHRSPRYDYKQTLPTEIGAKKYLGDYSSQFKDEKGMAAHNVVLCATVKVESRPFPEISALQACTTGASKCFCDINQFDFENGDDRYKSKPLQYTTIDSDSKKLNSQKVENANEVMTEIGTGGFLNVPHREDKDAMLNPVDSEKKKEHHEEHSDVPPQRGTIKSEPDMSTQTRVGRLNCWRPESGGCALGMLNKDKRNRGEQRPASWSHINSDQKLDIRNAIRPCSAATGDTVWPNEGAISIAMAVISTSSSGLDPSPSPSTSSLPQRQKSNASIDNDKSCHSEELNVSEASNKSTCRSVREPRIRSITSKTSLNDYSDSFQAQVIPDSARPLSAQSLTKENLHRSRPTSAQSSQNLSVQHTNQISHQSLPQLSVRSSRHNLSRSLSNHSSGGNAMHSPRPPSSDSLKHSPRPPSGHGEEKGLRKVRSRPSSLHLSESITTAVQRFSNHNLSMEPTKKSSFHLSEQSHTQQVHTSCKEEDVLSKQKLSSTQIKLPPIKTSVNPGESRQLSDTWSSVKSQPVRLPPVNSAGSGVLIGSHEKPNPATERDGDELSSWPTTGTLRGSALPPVLGRDAKPESTPMLGKSSNGIEFKLCGEATTHASNIPGYGCTYRTNSKEQLKITGPEQDIRKECSSPAQENLLLPEKSEHGDPKPSPTGSQTGIEEVSRSHSLAQSGTSGHLARLLAAYLPHKYSRPADASILCEDRKEQEPAITAGTDSAERPNDSEDKAKDSENGEVGANAISGNFPKDTLQSSDIRDKDDTNILFELSNGSTENSANGMNGMSGKYPCGSEKLDESDKLDQDKEELKAVSPNETSNGYMQDSTTPADYTSSLSTKSSNHGREANSTCDNVHAYSDIKTEVEEICSGLSESTTAWKSNLDEGQDIKSILQRYAISINNTKSNVESSADMPGDKSETEEFPSKLDGTGSSAEPECISSVLKAGISTLEHTSTSPADDSQIESRDRLPSKDDEQDKPKSSPPEFDITALMTKYATAFSDEKLSQKQTENSENVMEHVIPEDSTHASNGNVTLDNKNIPAADEGKGSCDEYKTSDMAEGDLNVEKWKISYLTSEDNPDNTTKNEDVLRSETHDSVGQTPVINVASLVAKFSSGDTGNKTDVVKNASNGIQIMRSETENVFALPAKDQPDPSKDESGFCSLSESKCTAPEEALNLLKPACHEENDVEKLNGQLYSLNEDVDYMTKLSEKMSSFGERFADISSLTRHSLTTDINKTTETVAISDIPTITNVFPMGVSTNKPGEQGVSDSLKEPLDDELCCSKNTPLEPRAETEDTLRDAVVEYSLTEERDTLKQFGNEIKSDNLEDTTNDLNITSDSSDKIPIQKINDYLLKRDQTVVNDGITNAEAGNIGFQDNLHASIEEDQGPTKDLSLSGDPPVGGNENSPHEHNRPKDFTTLDKSNIEQEDDVKTTKVEHLGSINKLSAADDILDDKEKLNLTDNDKNQPTTNEPNDENNLTSAKLLSSANNDINCPPVSQQDHDNSIEAEHQETFTKPATDAISPPKSPSHPKEETLEGHLPENLPSERIDTIKKQIYEEGLKPCQRDGGVAFFIPVSNAGLQPPVSNLDLGERLAKPKKSSMSYEERMIMADINRQEQLCKKKEFAVKDIINVKSATTSSSSTSGENISGGGHHERPDTFDSGSPH